jgi:hypothetical protein
MEKPNHDALSRYSDKHAERKSAAILHNDAKAFAAIPSVAA